ncbi:MAG: cyclic nucleotide-binding domain-containing protein [Planctomycetota bacterium]
MWARLLDVRPGESRMLVLLGGHLFLLLAALGVLMTAAEAVFLVTYPYAWIAYIFIGGAVLSVVASFAHGALERRASPRQCSTIALGALAATLVVLRAIVFAWPSGGPFVLFLVAQGFGVVVALESGGLVTRALDARQARRLYPAISGIGGVGASAGSFLVGILSRVLAPVDLLWVAAACLALPIALAGRVRGSHARAEAAEPAPWHEVVKNRFPLLLIAIVALSGVLSTMAKFQFTAAVKETLEGPEIARYVGMLYGTLSAVSILFGFFVTRHLVGRLGVGASLMLYPVIIAAAGLGGVLVPGLVVASGTMFSERLLRQNVQRPLLNIAMMPLPPQLASRTKLAVRGVVENAAIGIASIALLLLGPHIPWQRASVVLLLGGVAALACSWAARRRYARELVAALHTRRLETSAPDDTPWTLDARTRAALHEQLGSETPDRAALALRLLEGRADDETVRIVRAAWSTWRPWLRVIAVRAIAASSPPRARAFLESLDATTDPDAFAERLRCDPGAVGDDVLERCLQGKHPGLAAAAAIRRIHDGASVPDLDRWGASPDAAWRQAAAQVHAATWSPDDPRLVDLLDTAPDAVLAEAAVRPLPALAAPISARLAEAQHLPATTAALQRMGSDALEALAEAAGDARRAAQALALLLTLPGDAAREQVVTRATGYDATIRGHALRALLHASRGLSAEEARRLAAVADQEYRLCQARHAARAHPEPDVRREGATLLQRSLERLFLVLALLEPEKPYRRVHLSLASDVDSERAFAVEALDELLEEPWRERLVPLLDSGADSGQPDLAPIDADPVLTEVAASLGDGAPHPHLARARVWQRAAPLDALALDDLRALSRATEAHQAPGPRLQVCGDRITNLAAAISGSESVAAADDPPLAALWEVLAARPPAARAWLRRLSGVLSPPATTEPDVSVSGASLASRTPADASSAAEDLRRWQRSFYLGLVPLLAPLPLPLLRSIADICRLLPVRAGTSIVREGRPAGHAYVVCRGTVEVLRPGGRASTLQAGEAFGVLGLLSGGVRRTRVTALTDGELLAIDRVDFGDLLVAQPGLVQAFSRLLAERATQLAGP